MRQNHRTQQALHAIACPPEGEQIEEVLIFEEKKLFRELKEEKYCNLEWNLHQIDNFRSIRTGKDDSL